MQKHVDHVVAERVFSVEPVVEGKSQKEERAWREIWPKVAVILNSTKPDKCVSLNCVEVVEYKGYTKGVPVRSDAQQQENGDREESVAQDTHTYF